MATTFTFEIDLRAALTAGADLFEYPGPVAAVAVAAVLAGPTAPPAWLAAASPEVQARVRSFAEAVAPLSQGAWEEIYTHTFDLQAEQTLNLGHQVFGEDWKRSTLLIELQAMMPRYGVHTGSELPDHLVWLLRLLAAAPADDSEVQDLRGHCLLPGVRALTGKLAEDNPYTALLHALTLLLMEPVAAGTAASNSSGAGARP